MIGPRNCEKNAKNLDKNRGFLSEIASSDVTRCTFAKRESSRRVCNVAKSAKCKVILSAFSERSRICCRPGTPAVQTLNSLALLALLRKTLQFCHWSPEARFPAKMLCYQGRTKNCYQNKIRCKIADFRILLLSKTWQNVEIK